MESSVGSGSGSAFIDSLHSERKTRKASRCVTDGEPGPEASRRAKTTLSICVRVALAVDWMVSDLETR